MRPLLPDHIVAIAKAAYAWGIPAKHIARALGVKESNIWNWANEVSCARIPADPDFASKLDQMIRGEEMPHA